jgi:4-amino-4-deoxy-L-arabinose transferase-like glycosyltransferase
MERFIIGLVLIPTRRRCYMAKLSAWLVTLIGVVYLLPLIGVNSLVGATQDWIIALAFVVMGIGKLMRNYGKKR